MNKNDNKLVAITYVTNIDEIFLYIFFLEFRRNLKITQWLASEVFFQTQNSLDKLHTSAMKVARRTTDEADVVLISAEILYTTKYCVPCVPWSKLHMSNANFGIVY